MLGRLKNIELRQKAAGKEPGTMYITITEGSDISANTLKTTDKPDCFTSLAMTEVEVVRIDDDIQEPVTFIKMDIEGAEKDALIGCKEQIQTNRPNLAICTYHGHEDIILIPKLIDEYAPGYKFFMRHHGGNQVPTEYSLLAAPYLT